MVGDRMCGKARRVIQRIISKKKKNNFQPVTQVLIVSQLLELSGKWPSSILRRSNLGEVHSLFRNKLSKTQDDWHPFDPVPHAYQELAPFDFRDFKKKGTEMSSFV